MLVIIKLKQSTSSFDFLIISCLCTIVIKKERLRTIFIQLMMFISFFVYAYDLIVSILINLVNVLFLLKTELNNDEKQDTQ